MEKYRLKNLSKSERQEFYQSKYDYYHNFIAGLITVSVVAYITFFFTDCGIFGRFANETLLARLIILIPYVLFQILSGKVRDYRILVPCMYLMIHMIIWATDWATYLLPDRQHAISGMIIMNLIFVCAGFAAPLYYSVAAHLFLIVDIAVANLFIHYDNLSMMYLFNVPCILAILVMHRLMQNIALEQHMTKGKLKNLVVVDQLTGVGNRNKFREIVDAQSGEFLFPENQSASILLMDIDYFKKINDQHGHDAGDIVLEYLGKILRETVQDTDYVIRWGGEEFLVLLPGSSIEQGEQMAETIREKTETGDNGVCHVTVSVGVALYEGGDCHRTIKQADEAMYQAKNSGRNKVVVYSSTSA